MYAGVKPEVLESEFEQSFGREPYSYSWGFFAYDDSSGAAGGGAGNFSWFDKKEELVRFLQKFPLLAHSLGTTDADLLRKPNVCYRLPLLIVSTRRKWTNSIKSLVAWSKYNGLVNFPIYYQRNGICPRAT